MEQDQADKPESGATTPTSSGVSSPGKGGLWRSASEPVRTRASTAQAADPGARIKSFFDNLFKKPPAATGKRPKSLSAWSPRPKLNTSSQLANNKSHRDGPVANNASDDEAANSKMLARRRSVSQ